MRHRNAAFGQHAAGLDDAPQRRYVTEQPAAHDFVPRRLGSNAREYATG
jgi:hypothetical protein